MVYLQIVISREAAHETIKQLGMSLTSSGEHPGLQFTDVSPHANTPVPAAAYPHAVNCVAPGKAQPC